MKFTPVHLAALLSLAVWSNASVGAPEADIDQVRAATAKLISQLVDQGVLAREKGQALLDEVSRSASPPPAAPVGAGAGAATRAAASDSAAAGKSAAAPGTVRVPYIPEFVRKELKEEIRMELAAQAFREGWSGPGSVPAWVRGLEWEGDLRVRAQFDRFASGNAPAISISDTNRSRSLSLLNTDEDRDRLRVRARIGLNFKIDDHWSGGVRLTTGSATDPLSANQTLGTFNNRYTVLIDRAYLRYRHGDEFSVTAGRFGNPWFGTDLLWANDLSFDGVTAQWTPRLTSEIRGFATLAAMPVQEVELAQADKWLFGTQVGATLASSPRTVGAKVGLGYYHYTHLLGRPSPVGSTANEYTAPQFAQKGNSYYNISSDTARPLLALASEYRLLNLTGQVDFPSFAGKRVMLTGDYVRNLGFDRSQVSGRVGTDVDPQVTGYHARVAFGNTELTALHDWQVFMAYKRIERDAVLDAFTDSDFRLGGTDAKGYILGASYGLGKNTAAALRYFSGDSISGPPLSIDVVQLDLSVRF